MRFALILSLFATPLAGEVRQGPPNADFEPAYEAQTRAPELDKSFVRADVLVRGLVHPWGIASLPEGRFLVTERPGRLRVMQPDGSLSDPVTGLPPVDARRQGGLLDVAVGPHFEEDRLVYWTYAKAVEGGTVTAAARGRLSEDMGRIEGAEDIFVQSPPSPVPMHYGSRILVSAEEVIVTTGEHSREDQRVLAQDLDTTYGKVIRLSADGRIPQDNPFGDAILTYGHRNMQGAARDGAGRLWTIEHGPKGGDELNLIEAGRNYGWPVISYGVNYDGSPVGSGEAVAEGMEPPVYYWDPVIAPGGMVFYAGAAFEDWEGDLLIGSLNPGGLVRLRLEEGRVTGEERLLRELGRVRDVEVTEDGTLLLLIDAEDGAVFRVSPG